MIKPYYEETGIQIFLGDNRDIMAQLPKESIDSICTDPPYGIGFMGKEWDRFDPELIHRSFQEWCQEWAELTLECVKPGGIMVCFGGTRTWHRLTCGIEDAGWQIRDCLMWLYGSGFPKSLDISKAIDKSNGHWRVRANGVSSGNGSMTGPNYERTDKGEPINDLAKEWSGWGTTLKPAWEPIVLAMKGLDGTFAENAAKHGVAGLNIDGSRIATSDTYSYPNGPGGCNGYFHYKGRAEKPAKSNSLGRWPANLLLDEESAEMLDREAGELKSGYRNPTFSASGNGWKNSCTNTLNSFDGDLGGASRFFYIAKADNGDRGNQDSEELPLFNQTDSGFKNSHPTVKPLDLMEKLLILQTYLLKLTSTPTGGIVLDPFMGSGSTLVAAKRLGRPAIGIEKEKQYADITIGRLKQTQKLLVSL